MSLPKHLGVFQSLYASINGYHLSRNSRLTNDAMEYVYGEIDFTAFIALLSLTKPAKNTVFYDLGSGTGKAVIACAMVFDVKKCCGIELFQALHQSACKQQVNLGKLPSYYHKAKNIQFICGNFLNLDFNDATLIFINATSFFGETWQKLNEKIADAYHCQTVISTSKPLLSPAFYIYKITRVSMSWGIVNAYIHHRVCNL